MGVFERIGLIIRSNINDLLTRAEDPEKIINQTIMDMHQAQYEARMEVAQAIAEGKKLERDYQANQREAQSWLEKAEQALKAGREDLAREALRRKKAAEDLAGGLKEQLDAHNVMVERLKTQLRALDAKIGEAERKRQLLIARQQRSQAQEAVGAAMAKTDTRKAFAAFERMESKITQREDRLAAEAELAADLSLDDDFAALGADNEVEDELAALKAKLGTSEG
ncbi:MAG: PspA/IM30 family protein [Truepera sp.]|nr:PspA/IM30 family protein [Truepera sp.]